MQVLLSEEEVIDAVGKYAQRKCKFNPGNIEIEIYFENRKLVAKVTQVEDKGEQ